jgi:hypothetical protein
MATIVIYEKDFKTLSKWAEQSKVPISDIISEVVFNEMPNFEEYNEEDSDD